MRVRWSQLAYRLPGSDNELGLAKVYQSPNSYSVRFSKQEGRYGEEEVGYLAIVPVGQAMERELDEWVELDPESVLERDSDLWTAKSTSPEKRNLRQFVQMVLGRCLAFAGVR